MSMATALPTPKELLTYLEATGWTCFKERSEGRIAYFERDVEGEKIWVMVPRDEGFTDWRLRIRDAVQTVADVLDKPYEETGSIIRSRRFGLREPARHPEDMAGVEIAPRMPISDSVGEEL